ncbi:elongation factor 1-beta [Desulfurococcus mucosus]|uniref:Elongation factor 1-beta n=1 Tax=Desulfurococcus mucosus (strain ATCC 35584 / DSM 2162 / JCM 9187 / O7/1) TaxID=765177 RepID=E8RA90_DESM0|nr:elongation factor 1-beta [Desulfurococcus mucosus]ADV65396.1 translation elongation factor 1B (aEF-1B) [Desulfurococcus mucosus DSM 2162]
MAQVLVIVKVLPEDVETPLEELRERISDSLPQGYELKMWDEEPIAFGLKALRLAIVMPEETEGGTEALENLLSQVQGVSQVEVEYVNRLS